MRLPRGLGLDVLIETHHERELDRVLERLPEARLIGINNRDLKTFTTDLAITLRLAKRIPSGKLIVSESGIHQRADVVRLVEAGVHAMLVGESLIRADDIGEKIRELTRSAGSVARLRWLHLKSKFVASPTPRMLPLQSRRGPML